MTKGKRKAAIRRLVRRREARIGAFGATGRMTGNICRNIWGSAFCGNVRVGE